MRRTHLLPTVALVAATLLAGCPSPAPPGPVPRSVLVLPPDSPALDPLLASDQTRLAEPWRRLLVEVGRDVLPRATVEELERRGVLSVGLSAAALAQFVTADPDGIEQRIGYRALAEAHHADHLLKLTYDGSIRQSAGTVEWLGGWFALAYPSDTMWYRLTVEAKLVDAASGQVVRTLAVDAEDHSSLVGQLGGRTNRDRLVDLAREVAESIADTISP